MSVPFIAMINCTPKVSWFVATAEYRASIAYWITRMSNIGEYPNEVPMRSPVVIRRTGTDS